MNWLGRPLSWAYGGAIQLRNNLFDRGIMSSSQFDVPVISVGNITTGGTGKTPVIQSLIHWALENNYKPGVVSRGYGGNYTDVQEVDVNLDSATELFGDEPVLTKAKFPSVPFYVCRERSRAVSEMLKTQDVNLVLADDAFQHRALSRDLDIVLIDATQNETQYKLLPEGRLREPLEELSRAHFVMITKWNLASDHQKEFLSNLVMNNTSSSLDSIIHCKYEISNWNELETLGSVQLATAIGNPKAFEMMLSQKLEVNAHKKFRDHHPYTKSDIDQLLQSGLPLITTEKDFVKIKATGVDTGSIYVAKLELTFDESMEKLFGAINKLSH